MRKSIVVITAAGLGIRLKEYSFKKYNKYLDKPLVEFLDKSLLNWSIKPLFPLITAGIIEFSDIYLVIRKEQDFQAFKDECEKINKRINIIVINKLTKGPAHTALEALKLISKIRSFDDRAIIISDSDHTFRCDRLLSYFKQNKSVNVFCTLKNVENPDKWGYIIANEKGEYTSGEKDFYKQSDQLKKRAEFLIGCYVYKDFATLVRGINEFESTISINRESHHSLVLSLLSKTEEVISINANWGIGLGTPEQLEKTSNAIISFAGNREPSTYVIDIDGVIFQHDVGSFSDNGDFSDNPIPIKENVELINKLYDKGCFIVLCSSRPKRILEKTKLDLSNIDLKYSEIIHGATSGIRYLINDMKPSNKSIDTAIAVNSIRDKPFKLNKLSSVDFLRDCSKGSGASTVILKDLTSNNTFVRKWTDSNNKDVCMTLYKQYSYLKSLYKYIPYSLPEVLDWDFRSNGINYYDMSYLKADQLSINSFFHDSQVTTTLFNILASLYEGSTYLNQYQSFNDLSVQIIKNKLNPCIYNCINDLSILIDAYKEFLPRKFEQNIQIKLDKLTNKVNLWSKQKSCLVHGDLTLENIFREDNSLYLIDPLGSTMDIRMNGSMEQFTSPVFDIGKLLQSLLSKYEEWAYLDNVAIDLFIRNFSVEEDKIEISNDLKLVDNLFNFYREYISENIIFDSLFSLAQILIRVAPYRIRAGYNHSALLCLLKSYAIIEYLEES